MAMTALDGWRRYIETRDESILRAILHPDVVFESPVVFTPQRGRVLPRPEPSSHPSSVGRRGA